MTGPLGEPVEITPHDPEWAGRFAAYARQISAALGGTAHRVDHVGSTAVPGLAAKPVIDIQVVVTDHTDEPRYRPALESTGITWQFREPERVFFRPATLPRTHHVHVTSAASPRERRQLLFVAYLTADQQRRQAYQDLKLRLATQHGHDRLAYTEAKGRFITDTLRLAETWAATTGWAPPRTRPAGVVR